MEEKRESASFDRTEIGSGGIPPGPGSGAHGRPPHPGDRPGGQHGGRPQPGDRPQCGRPDPEETNDRTYDARQRLEEVNMAIQAVLLGGQSYRIGSRSLTRADLSLLKSMRDDLEAQIAQEDTCLLGSTYVAFFTGTGR